MGCINETILSQKTKKKFLSYYIVFTLVTTVFLAIVPSIGGESNTYITTYHDDDIQNPDDEFRDNDLVIVKVNTDGAVGDPDPPYKMRVVNETGEDIEFFISDNQSFQEFGITNDPDDSEYWGLFEIGMGPTFNSTNPESPSYLHLNNNESANITELFDVGAHVNYTIIYANYSGGPDENAIEGEVKDQHNIPISGVTVLLNYTQNQTGIGMNLTDGTGFFEFFDIGPGNYTLTFLKDSEPGFPEEIIVNYTHGIHHEMVIINQSGEGPGGEPQWNGTLMGKVKDFDTGDPIENAEIVVERIDQPQPPGTVFTNANGEYLFNQIESGFYNITAHGTGFSQTQNNYHIIANQTNYLNFSIQFGGGGPEFNGTLTVNGTITDYSGTPLSNVFVEMFKHHEPPFENSTTMTNQTGYYEFNLSVPFAGPGAYELMAEKEGYLGYCNWSVFVEGQSLTIDIVLPEYFDEPTQLMGRVTDIETGQVVNNTEIMLIDTDFSHMMEMEDEMDFLNNQTIDEEEGWFNISVRYPGAFLLVAFAEGYYASMSDPIIVTMGGTQQIYNFTMNPAMPDQQQLRIEFTDLDDIHVTLNRTIIAESQALRFVLDFMPDIGNSDSQISEEEANNYLEMLNKEGPSVGLSLDGEDDEGKDGGGGPDFLTIPVNFLLDSYTLDYYQPGTFNASFSNLVNTSIQSNQTIYFNATFDLTLEGTLLNQLAHNFTTYCEYANIINNTILVDFAEFYNISMVNTNTNVSAQQQGNTVSLTYQNGSVDELAYSWVDLEINTTSLQLPIFETPQWYVTDTWCYNKVGNWGTSQITQRVSGKPFQEWDMGRFRIGDEQANYICYEIQTENQSEYYNDWNTKFASINNLDWIVSHDWMGIDYVVNDLDFPLYADKVWQTYSWWGEMVNATIISMSSSKQTDDGQTYDCVLVHYTNLSTGQLLGKEWYCPELKTYVNRTKIIGGQTVGYKSLFDHQLAPYIVEISTPHGIDTNGNSLYDVLQINITLNTSGLTQPTNLLLEGPLYKENQSYGPPEDITWISQEIREITNDTNPYIYTVNYSGDLIRSKEVNGPYQGHFELREFGEWGPEATIDFIEFETQAFNSTDFETPSVFVENISSYGNDTNSNSRYDYLTLNVTITVTEPGDYSMHGGIDYVISHTYWDEWWWITGTGTPTYHLENGTHTIPLNFDGREIFDRGYSGQYHYHFEIMNDNTWERIYERDGDLQEHYNYSDFETPSIYFNHTYMSQSAEHDYINGSNAFTVNVSVIVEEGSLGGGSSWYDLHGGLHYYNASSDQWEDHVTGCGMDVELTEGDNIIPFNFDLNEIYNRMQEDNYNGSFAIGIGLSDVTNRWNDIDNVDYITANYSLGALPEPAISMVVYNETITQEGESLAISLYINITDDYYANKTYDIHGGVHYLEGEEEWWHFITGMGMPIDLGYGCNDLTINFSGMEIASSGHDGPYMIWIGLEEWQVFQEVAHVEHRTANYTIQQFCQPSVIIDVENVSDSINGSDYYTLNIPINVTEEGEYDIHGCVHWIDTSHGWDEWRWITDTGICEPFAEGEHNVTLNFDQGMIKNELEREHYDGPLMIHIGVGQPGMDGFYQPITNLEYQTQPYSEADFSEGSLCIIGIPTTQIDGSGNLVVNMTINSTKEISYRFHGGVHCVEQMDGWENWIFITGMCEDTVDLEIGTNYKEFIFNGREIFNSMRNGPYKIWIGIENATNWHMVTNIEFDTAAYNYNEFSAASGGVRIKKENMSFGTVDYMNGTYLTVNVTIVKTTEGTETLWLDGGLEYVDDQHGIWEWITGTGREMTLQQGNNTFPLNFNAGEISNSGRDGPYRVWLNIRDDSSWMDVDHYEYTTQAYNAADAPEPPIRFAELGPEDSYINDSMFIVNVSINVTDAAYEGEYDLHGGVHFQHQDGWWEHITGGGNWMMLENGSNTVEFSFNAGEINQRLPEEYDGPLSVFMGINQMGNWEEIARYDYETRSYTKDDFPGPEVTMQITDAQPNGSYFTVNVTVDVDLGSAGEYDLHGGVNWIDTSRGWDEWRFITGCGQPVELSDGLNEVQLNFNGGEIYQTLQEEDVTSRLSIWMGINSMESWMELTHDEYMTPEEFSYTDFSPPQLSIECISDYNNDTDYLTINVSINASGDMLGEEYDIHAGIHWKSGWEWRFITGYGQPLTINENMTFALNFNGGAIRACEHDGPYEVWVGISSMDSWEDITHDEYTTQAYSYTEFAAPSVQILRGNLQSYVNGSTALTINVTVNATETGTYFLEGGLDWVDGFHWQWIGWTGQDITIDSVGEQTFALNFNAQDLKRAADEGWNGQELVAWLGVMNTSNWQEISRIEDYRLTGYSPDDFATLPVQFGDGEITDEGVGNTPYSELEITVPLNVSSVGDYEIIAGLFDEMTNTLIAKTNASITGTPSSITVSFNGTKINKKHINGTYEFRAKLINSSSKTEYDRRMWFTDHYDYTDFEEAVAEAFFENDISSLIVTGDLQVSVVVNVTQTGNQFEIYGELFDENGTFIAFASTTQWLNTTGNHTINLLFDGTKINTAELNGPYVLEFLRLSIDEEFGWEELDHKIDSHTTAAYDYSSFGGGPL